MIMPKHSVCGLFLLNLQQGARIKMKSLKKKEAGQQCSPPWISAVAKVLLLYFSTGYFNAYSLRMYCK